MEGITLLQGDCLDLMKGIPDKSVDMILCDPPYGTTNNKWDVVIQMDKMWENYRRVLKENGCVALFCDGMFMAKLMLSNERWWRYNLIWEKVIKTGFLNANRMPLRSTEEIAVFYEKQPTYNPQKVKGVPSHSKGRAVGSRSSEHINRNYGEFLVVDNSKLHGDNKFPGSIISISKPHPSVSVHPTQKPVELLEWLIKTYTNDGETVLDNCMGSGSTGVACVNTGRKFIGMELCSDYFEVASDRIKEAYLEKASRNKFNFRR